LTIHNVDATHAQVFVSNVLSGTVTRINLGIPEGGTPWVESETQIASRYIHRTDPAALVVGPTGLAYDAKTDTLYVAATGNNAIYAIAKASVTNTDQGRGQAVVIDPQHLHGPLALALAPNGDLIAANGDAVNPDPNQLNELVEYTKQGKFVGQFQVDSGAAGAAFGLAVQQIGGQVRFAAVDDNENALKIWAFDTTKQATSGGLTAHRNSTPSSPSTSPSSSVSSPISSAPTDPLVQAVDAFFQAFNAEVRALEASLQAIHPELSGFFSMVNADLVALEAMIVSKL
jgi:DNA-binding beta-propeller fold protein YncE